MDKTKIYFVFHRLCLRNKPEKIEEEVIEVESENDVQVPGKGSPKKEIKKTNLKDVIDIESEKPKSVVEEKKVDSAAFKEVKPMEEDEIIEVVDLEEEEERENEKKIASPVKEVKIAFPVREVKIASPIKEVNIASPVKEVRIASPIKPVIVDTASPKKIDSPKPSFIKVDSPKKSETIKSPQKSVIAEAEEKETEMDVAESNIATSTEKKDEEVIEVDDDSTDSKTEKKVEDVSSNEKENKIVKPEKVSKKSDDLKLGRRESGRFWKSDRDRFRSVIKSKGLKQVCC